MNQKFLEEVKHAPIEDLAYLFKILSEKVYAHRVAHKGCVPLPIFADCMSIGGTYACVEVIIEVEDENGKRIGYALKKRENGEQGWQGKYQIAGTIVRMSDTTHDAFTRLTGEIFGNGTLALRENEMEFVGVNIRDEQPERFASCVSVTWLMRIHSLEKLAGEWKVFADPDDEMIIDFFREALKWASIPASKRERFVDLRKTKPLTNS